MSEKPTKRVGRKEKEELGSKNKSWGLAYISINQNLLYLLSELMVYAKFFVKLYF